MTTIIETNQIVKEYRQGGRNIRALNEVNIQITTGEFVAVMGQSGSGKSTLLHLLGGLETPTSGKIFIEGSDIAKLKPTELALFRRRKIGFIFQFFNLIEELTVFENIILPSSLDRKDLDSEFIKQTVSKLQIDGILNAYPAQLSGGQQQRVAIARALSIKPAIILADEPTGNLDSRTAHEIMDLFCMCKNQLNQTIMMVTHDANISSYADRTIRFHDGEILKED